MPALASPRSARPEELPELTASQPTCALQSRAALAALLPQLVKIANFFRVTSNCAVSIPEAEPTHSLSGNDRDQTAALWLEESLKPSRSGLEALKYSRAPRKSYSRVRISHV
jgi:hypothetical protein